MSRTTQQLKTVATALAFATATGLASTALAGNCSSGGYAASDTSTCGSSSPAAVASTAVRSPTR